MTKILYIFAVIGMAIADVSHILDETTSTTYPPRPYAFQYQAGRYHNGHVDRTHAEVGDGAGTVRGAFSYVDPRNEVRTVEYVADKNGFHPQLSHPVQNTKAVELANQRHFALYNKIAERNSNPNYAESVPVQSQSEAVQRETQRHAALYNKIAHQNSNPEYAQAVSQPRDTVAVAHAKENHLNLFDKIAAEHARLGEEQLALRIAFEATSVRNEEDDYKYQQ